MYKRQFLIVAVDVPFQIWQYHDKLKMSRQEVKQEGKELEGNPEIKGRIRQLQREAARKRMMAAVPAADVIVTNPTHFAIALAYRSGMRAPKVLAKGMGDIGRIQHPAGRLLGEVGDTIEPVSYTLLDVYKRQCQRSRLNYRHIALGA